ncbi:MAG: AMP phosphorylase [Candidatus Bathyarchaeia archaeon]
MKLKVREVNLDAGGRMITILNSNDAEELGVRSLGRIKLIHNDRALTAIVNTTKKIIREGEIGVFDEVKEKLKVNDRDLIDVDLATPPKSLDYIRNRLQGRRLTRDEIREIVFDTVNGNLSEVEIASFVTSLHHKSLDLEEAMNLSLSMVEVGKTLKLDKKLIVDKHSIGGIPGDKTTLLVVPIVASFGLSIPKSSSRAITSAAGTADRAEILMPVNLDLKEMEKVVSKTNGCIVWGGAIDLSPADDIFIKVEFPLSIDPLLLPSILSKKKAVGSKFVVIDIPCGWGAKVKTLEEAHQLARDFIELGEKIGININCAITYGNQPIGYSIGPALEAKEALENLMLLYRSEDLLDKATDMAGMIFDMVGEKDGKSIAMELLKSGKAEKKLREIIEAQGGDPKVKPEEIPIGQYSINVKSDRSGYVILIKNHLLVKMARYAGAPKDKGAGIRLYKKIGDPVKKDETLFTVYAEKESKLDNVVKVLEEERAMQVGKKLEMTMDEVKGISIRAEEFILER